MTDAMNTRPASVPPPEGGDGGAGPAERAAPSRAAVWSQLSKARLSLLVLLTTAVGYVVAPPNAAAAFGSRAWLASLGWTCLGTALAAASAEIGRAHV